METILNQHDRDAGTTSVILPEILSLCAATWPTIDLSSFKECYKHVTDFFKGENPYFDKNILPYHNLRHTRLVILATARIFHGLHLSGTVLRSVAVEKGLLCALFHDTGLLSMRTEHHPFLKTIDTLSHEKRSAQLMRTYVNVIGLPIYLSIECEEIINHTNLQIAPKTIECSSESRIIGQVVGSADLIAQMADRYYLECLSSLFYEMKVANNNNFPTMEEMMKHTSTFYQEIQERLENQLGGVHHSLKHHFFHQHLVDRNIYLDQITANIDYLTVIIEKCYGKDEKITDFLRRTPPKLE